MTTRRIAYWWFRFVFSGRFLERFLVGRPGRPTSVRTPDLAQPRREPQILPADDAAPAAPE